MITERSQQAATGFEPQQETTSDALVFWGSRMVFSDWILRVASAESGFMNVLRVDDPSEVPLAELTQRRALKLVVFEATLADPAFHNIRELRKTTGAAHWAMAYTHAEQARRLLSARQQNPDLPEMLLLPMHVPIDTWSPLFRLVLSGNFFVPGDLLDRAATADSHTSALRGNGSAKWSEHGLTRREKEVLAMVAKGRRNKTIAYEMGLSEHTIKLHLHHIVTKIGVKNRTAAANWYLSQPHQGEP